MRWKPQAWRSDVRSVALETDVGTFTVNWNGSNGWHLGWIHSELEGNITIDNCVSTDTIARNIAEFIVMSRRTWYTLDHPGGKPPTVKLNEAGYIVDMCPEAPNYAWVYAKPRSEEQHIDANKFLCYDAMKKFLNISLIVDYEFPSAAAKPAPWILNDATKDQIAKVIFQHGSDNQIKEVISKMTPTGWKRALPPLPTTGWKS